MSSFSLRPFNVNNFLEHSLGKLLWEEFLETFLGKIINLVCQARRMLPMSLRLVGATSVTSRIYPFLGRNSWGKMLRGHCYLCVSSRAKCCPFFSDLLGPLQWHHEYSAPIWGKNSCCTFRTILKIIMSYFVEKSFRDWSEMEIATIQFQKPFGQHKRVLQTTWFPACCTLKPSLNLWGVILLSKA